AVVEDQPVGTRRHEDLRTIGADKPVSRSRQEEPAVRIRLAQARTEPSVAQGKRAGEAVIEGKVGFGPVTHCDGPAGAHEAVVATVVVLDVAGVPVLTRSLGELAGARHPERTDDVALVVPVRGPRAAVVVERESVTAA